VGCSRGKVKKEEKKKRERDEGRDLQTGLKTFGGGRALDTCRCEDIQTLFSPSQNGQKAGRGDVRSLKCVGRNSKRI